MFPMCGSQGSGTRGGGWGNPSPEGENMKWVIVGSCLLVLSGCFLNAEERERIEIVRELGLEFSLEEIRSLSPEEVDFLRRNLERRRNRTDSSGDSPSSTEIAFLRAVEIQDRNTMDRLVTRRARAVYGQDVYLGTFAREWARKGGVRRIDIESETIDPRFPNRAQLNVVVLLNDGSRDRFGATLIKENGQWKVN